MSEDSDIRVQLARMEGKQDVTNERLNNVQTDIADIRRTQNNHGDRLGILERDNNIRSGERKGIGVSGKAVWGVVSFVLGSGGVLALLELLK